VTVELFWLRRKHGDEPISTLAISWTAGSEANPEIGKKFGVEGFPTILFLPRGLNDPRNTIKYTGDRRGEAFLAFIKKQ